jgi:hypothetical protein
MKDLFERRSGLQLIGLALLPYAIHISVTTAMRFGGLQTSRSLDAGYFWVMTVIALLSAGAAASLVTRTRLPMALLAGGLVLLNALLSLGMGCLACAASGS